MGFPQGGKSNGYYNDLHAFDFGISLLNLHF